jgi:hypothetical protein
MAINRNNRVVWKFITDARVGAHVSCVVDLLSIRWMAGTCQCSVPLWKLSRGDLNDLEIWFSFLDMYDTIIHVLTFFNCDELELSSLPVLKYYIKCFHFVYLQSGCGLGSSVHTLSYALNNSASRLISIPLYMRMAINAKKM